MTSSQAKWVGRCCQTEAVICQDDRAYSDVCLIPPALSFCLSDRFDDSHTVPHPSVHSCFHDAAGLAFRLPGHSRPLRDHCRTPVPLEKVSTFLGWSWCESSRLILQSAPLLPSRLVDIILKIIMRVMWFAGGFHWMTVKGRRALPAEAPILTLAPHSSYFDAIPVTMTMSSIVMKAESKDIPLWGSK